MSAAGLLLALAAAAAGAAGPAAPLPTRLVQLATQAEEELLALARARDARGLEQRLDDDFQMLVAQRPAEAVPLEDWVDAMTQRPGAGDYAVRFMAAREFAPGRLQASFLLQPRVRGPAPVFVVDLWQTDSSPWKLLSRQAALTGGAARAVPGYAPPQELPKKY